MFYRVAMFFLGIFWRCWFNLKIYGRENEPDHGGYILACNHCSAIDPMIFPQGIKRYYIHFMAKAELFDIPVLKTLIKWLKAFPVSRGAGDQSAIETAVHFIEQNEILGLFPEGTRSKDGNLHRFKSGLALIAQKTGAGVLPATITYTQGRKFRSKVILNYGEFIPFESLGVSRRQSEDPNPRELKVVTRYLYETMENLKLENLPIQARRLEEKEEDPQ